MKRELLEETKGENISINLCVQADVLFKEVILAYDLKRKTKNYRATLRVSAGAGRRDAL